ncbi:hypothetical protein BDN72DRAFT_766599 [Pluteus cervinus]|uniref:Uncharacterized protein n=1 Tax=Pluteus cervinus TaxID=181527 RepID=A0ACD3AXB5_9AGAR|nr:hypothetical protein BDN72DRAFT_766599 [Pluteus cervinus]
MLRTTLLPRPRRRPTAQLHRQLFWFSTTHRTWNAGRPFPLPPTSVEQTKPSGGSELKDSKDSASAASSASPLKTFQIIDTESQPSEPGDVAASTSTATSSLLGDHQTNTHPEHHLHPPKSHPHSTTSSESRLHNPETPSPPSTSTANAADPPVDTQANDTSSIDKIDLSVAVVKDRFREWSERAAIAIRHRADDFTQSTRKTFSQLGTHLNKVTGYEEIEALKKQVVDQEARIKETRHAAKEAKTAHNQAAIQRSNSQREVNDLLQRKSHWNDSDVGRFTTLVRQDHLYEQEEAKAKAAVDQSETQVEREFSRLMRIILARYHEEQVWSDKIRSASTYGSLAALGLNLVVFILAIIVVEPWKRRRLAQTFEKKVDELAMDNATRLEAGLVDLGRQLEEQEALLAGVAAEVKLALSQLEKGVALSSLISISEALEDKRTPVVSDTSPTPTGGGSLSSSRSWELAALGAGAFITGVVSCLFIRR